MIEFRNVGKNYNQQTHALNNVSFTVEAGEFIFLIGESGAGKSTMIKLLTCEERPTYGTVVLDQFDISRMKQRLVPFLRRKIGMIFQDFRLIESKTVFENVAFAMEIVGAPKKLIKRRVPMVLSVVGLRNKADAYPAELSGGEAQRVGIARAMVNNPRLILADEPTGNLDTANSEAIMALLDEINRAGTTVIACTHDVAMVERMNKRVIELKQGRIVRDEYPKKDIPLEGQSCFLVPEEERDSLKNFINEQKADRLGMIETQIPEHKAKPAEHEDHDERSAEMQALRDKLAADSDRRKNRISLPERIAQLRDPEHAGAESSIDMHDMDKKSVKNKPRTGNAPVNLKLKAAEGQVQNRGHKMKMPEGRSSHGK